MPISSCLFEFLECHQDARLVVRVAADRHGDKCARAWLAHKDEPGLALRSADGRPVRSRCESVVAAITKIEELTSVMTVVVPETQE